jgi:hypothetical protein
MAKSIKDLLVRRRGVDLVWTQQNMVASSNEGLKDCLEVTLKDLLKQQTQLVQK